MSRGARARCGVSASLSEVLGVSPAIGRSFRAEEDREGAAPVVILSFDVFRTRFGERSDILGKRLVLDGVSREIVGVMPERLDFPSAEVALYFPLEAPSESNRGQHGVSVVARMKEGVDLEAVNTELRGLASRLEAAYPDDNAGRGMWGETLYQSMVGETRDGLLLLFGAVGFVLLVACVNVAGILTSRALARAHERAIQSALGADRFTLFRQQLVESLVLAFAGGFLALGVAAGLRSALLALAPSDLPRASNVGTNPAVLAFAVGLSFAAALLFGALPALAGSRFNLRAKMGEGAREAGAGRATRRIRHGLLVGEIALAVVLVFGAGLLIRSFVALLRVDPGFGARNVLAVALDLPASRYPQRFPEWPRWNEVRAFQTEDPGAALGDAGNRLRGSRSQYPSRSGVDQPIHHRGPSGGRARRAGRSAHSHGEPRLFPYPGRSRAPRPRLLRGRRLRRLAAGDSRERRLRSALFPRRGGPRRASLLVGPHARDCGGGEGREISRARGGVASGDSIPSSRRPPFPGSSCWCARRKGRRPSTG